MNHTIKAEIYKLLHTKSCYIPLLIFMVVGTTFPVLVDLMFKAIFTDFSVFSVSSANLVFRSFPMMMMLILATISPAVGEYNNKVNHLTLAESPRRVNLVFAKLIASVVVVSGTALLTYYLWLLVAAIYGGVIMDYEIGFNNENMIAVPIMFALSSILYVMIGQGFAHLTRSFPMTFILVSLMMLKISFVVSAMLSIERFAKFTFARNIGNVWDIGSMSEMTVADAYLPLAICVTWAVAIFGAGLISYGKRNA